MREIKFRGKDLETKSWVYGSLIIKGKLCFIIPGLDTFDYTGHNETDITFYKWYEVDPETVGEFTGLKDKNGKEIYEGDIEKDGSVLRYGNYKVEDYSASYNSRSIQYDNFVGFFWKDNCGNDSHLHLDFEYEIIGNIYENGDLLK